MSAKGYVPGTVLRRERVGFVACSMDASWPRFGLFLNLPWAGGGATKWYRTVGGAKRALTLAVKRYATDPVVEPKGGQP